MQASRAKRLAELERSLAATHEQAREVYLDAIVAQHSSAEFEALKASLARQLEPGYVFTAEDKAIEQRWHEAVQAAVPADQRLVAEWREWALLWCEAVKSHA